MASTGELIEQAVAGIQREVPALAGLKMVIGLELRGRGDTQLYRVELPGPKVTKGYADDERLHVSIPRSHFNELAADGKISTGTRPTTTATSRSRATRDPAARRPGDRQAGGALAS